MKKTMMLMVAVITIMLSGCAISADTTSDLVYPSFDTQINKIEPKPYVTEIEIEKVMLEKPWVETQNGKHNKPNGASFISAKVQEGKQGHALKKFAVSYNGDGEELTRVELEEEMEVVPTTPTIYANYQPVQADASFKSGRITRYGYDCYGCNFKNERGSTAAGIQVGNNEVRQKNGTWKTGVTYEGYYIIAADRSVPLCTVVEISNHNISGNGITQGVPFKAIVLDRGSAITGTTLDLYAGSQRTPTLTTRNNGGADIKIISLNSHYRNGSTFNCGV